MKQKILLFLFCFLPNLNWAQTDTLLRNVYLAKANDYRISKALRPMHHENYFDSITGIIFGKSKFIKNSQGNFIDDSIRKILRKNKIYDYQFKIIEKSKPKDKNFELDTELKNALNDSLYNTIGLSSNESQEIVILIKSYMFNQGITLYPSSELMDRGCSLPIWGLQLSSTLKEVQYACLEKLEDLNNIKTLSTLKAQDSIFKIERMKNSIRYVIFYYKHEIIYIYDNR